MALSDVYCQDITSDSKRKHCLSLSPSILENDDMFMYAVVLKNYGRYELDWFKRCRGERNFDRCTHLLSGAYHSFVSILISHPEQFKDNIKVCMPEPHKLTGVDFHNKRNCIYGSNVQY